MHDKKLALRHQDGRSLMKETFILASSLLVFLLSYLATVQNAYMPDRWLVGCCGRAFWWSAVGAAVVLVGGAIALNLRHTFALILAAVMSTYVIYYSLYVAVERWNDYASLDKAYGLWQALLPLYRPLSVLLSIFVIITSMKNLTRRFSRAAPTESSRPVSTHVDN